MRYILGLDLANVVTFKKLSVDFDKNLTYVRGMNLDSDPAAPTGNGAGKTLMFSALANLIYQTTPHALKKKSKKDILRQRGSSVGLIMRQSADGPDYEILQTPKGYTIYEDGKDLELRTIPLAEEFISKLFPLSEIKFYSTCYLSTQRPYLIQRDTNANRLQHFSDIFNLDQYSGIRAVLATRLRGIKDDELKLSVLNQHLLGLRKKLKELVTPVSKEEYLEAKREYADLGKDMDVIQSERFALSTKQRDLSQLLTIENTLDRLRDYYKFKEAPAKMLAKLKAQRSASSKWERWHDQERSVASRRKKLEAKIADLDVPDCDLEVLTLRKSKAEKSIRKLDAQILELRSAKRARDSVDSKIKALTESYEALGIKGVIPDGDHSSELAVLRATLKLERLLSHDHGDSSQCPTCLTELDLDTIRSTVAAAKKKIARLERYAEAARICAELRTLEDDLPEFDAARLVELKELVSKKRESVESYTADISVLEAMESLTDQLGEIESPEPPDCLEPEYSADDISEYLDLCGNIVEALSQKDLLLSNHPELSNLRTEQLVNKALTGVSTKLEALDVELSEFRAAQGIAAGKVTAYEQYRNTGKVYQQELLEVQAKIAKLSPGLEDKKLLEILLKAYGAKGLRASAAESVCNLFQTNLNHYRDLIFAEPFTFSVIASETGISIMVDRNNGKPDSESDVRQLSGAESNSFQLLCLMSLLPLLPDSERVNIVVLDEPTSHMDEVSRAIFNSRFVPVLREIVPSVYIISPHADDVCPNSIEWVVKKQNGISTVLQN